MALPHLPACSHTTTTMVPYLNPHERKYTFMSLPTEIVRSILHILPFKDRATMATVCTGLRSFALADCKLWQEIPEATPDNIGDLVQFFPRSGELGMDLSISSIQKHHLVYVSELLWPSVHRVRSLVLHFEANVINQPRMVQLLNSLLRPMPKLERLHLTVDPPLDPVSDMPDWFTFCFTAPKLVVLELTAFTLLQPCPQTFANVTEVLTSVSAPCPYHQAGIPTRDQPQWANASLHRNFPAIRILKLLGIDPGSTGNDDACTLIRLPYIDRPLDELHLHFHPIDESFEDPDAVRWITEGTRNVRRLTLEHPDCVGVRDAALMTLAREPLSLHIQRWAEQIVQLSARTAEGKERAVRCWEDDLKAHLAHILDSPLMRAKELSLPADSALPAILALFAEYPHLEILELRYEGGRFPTVHNGAPGLPSVRTLRLESDEFVKVSAKVLGDFVTGVVPKVTTIFLGQHLSFMNPHLLPPTIHVRRMDESLPSFIQLSCNERSVDFPFGFFYLRRP